jgi:hypothetical protein
MKKKESVLNASRSPFVCKFIVFSYLSFRAKYGIYNCYYYELPCKFVDMFPSELPMLIDANVELLNQGY